MHYQIRIKGHIYETGDSFYYKRAGEIKRQQLEKARCQDSKIIFLCHGNVYVRVTPYQLIKIEDQWNFFNLENDIENISGDSNKHVKNNSVENCNIKNKNFITNDSPGDSDDENVTKIIILLIAILNMYCKIAHIMFTEKFV